MVKTGYSPANSGQKTLCIKIPILFLDFLDRVYEIIKTFYFYFRFSTMDPSTTSNAVVDDAGENIVYTYYIHHKR